MSKGSLFRELQERREQEARQLESADEGAAEVAVPRREEPTAGGHSTLLTLGAVAPLAHQPPPLRVENRPLVNIDTQDDGHAADQPAIIIYILDASKVQVIYGAPEQPAP